jgi:hypothetical protein
LLTGRVEKSLFLQSLLKLLKSPSFLTIVRNVLISRLWTPCYWHIEQGWYVYWTNKWMDEQLFCFLYMTFLNLTYEIVIWYGIQQLIQHTDLSSFDS